jgi:16S rRNA processing protein RimM
MIVMGRVRAPFGVKGWIKIQPFSQRPDGLLSVPEWWLQDGDGWVNYQVRESAAHGAALIAQLDGVDNRERAAELRGRMVAVPRAALPEPDAGEYYWSDLIGLRVENRPGQDLGTVRSLMETGANPVLVLEGERERLVPFVEGVIVTVDVPGGKIVADWEPDY